MTAKLNWIWIAGVFCIGGAVVMLGNPVWAADAPAANGTLQPVPNQSALPAQGIGDTGIYTDAQTCAQGECEECIDFCGLPCCSPPGRFWLRTDYLMWWTNGTSLPPLVTTSPLGTPVDQAGVLPDATVLYGDQTICNRGRSGWRVTVGAWLDSCHVWGVQGDYYALGREAGHYSHYSDGNPILARPLYDVEAIAQGRELVAYPNAADGTVSVDARDYFASTGVALTYNLCCSDQCDTCCDPCENSCLCFPLLFCCRTDFVLGYRHYRYSDSILITEDVRSLVSPTSGYRFQIEDGFRARNEFHGSEIGLKNTLHRGRWSLEILTKIALGQTHQVVSIDGQTIVTPPNAASTTRNGGVYAVRSNEGTYTNDLFTVIPQLSIDLGYQVNEHWRAYIGYNILYWASVVHAAEQIDLNVDPRNIPVVQDPATPFPAFSGNQSSFWAQGLNLGLEMRF